MWTSRKGKERLPRGEMGEVAKYGQALGQQEDIRGSRMVC